MAGEIRTEDVDKALFKLSSRQRQFIFDSWRYTGFYGGIRNGKTISGCLKGLLLSDLYPGNIGLIGRRTYKQLYDTTVNELFQIIKRRNGGTLEPGPYLKRYVSANAGPDAQTIILRPQPGFDSSKIRLRYAEDEENFLGQELGWFYLDQAEDIEEKIYEHLESRLSYWNATRRKEFYERKGFYPRHMGFITGNPAPVWVKKRWKEDTTGKYHLYEATTEENQANLEPGYIEELRATKPLDWVKRFIEGSWEVRGGMIFPEYSKQVHVIKYFTPPPHWIRVWSLDHGYRHPTAAHLTATDEQGNIFFYKEHCQAERPPSFHAAAIKALSIDEPIRRNDSGFPIVHMDPSTQGTNAVTQRSIMEEYRTLGIAGIPANNHVQAGILKIAEGLHVSNRHLHPITRQMGSPHIFIFEDRCPNLISELASYEWQPEPPGGNRGVEKPRKVADDNVDSCLAKGTMVQTISGPREIENVKRGDFVATREGFKKVLASAKTGKDKSVSLIRISDGREILATQNHPFFTKKYGFLPVDALRYPMMLHSLEESWNELSTKAKHTGAIQNQGSTEAGFIFQEQMGLHANCSIGLSGRTILEKYQTDSMSTTKTEIQPTIPLKILNASVLPNMLLSILGKSLKKCWNTLLESGPMRRSGINPKKAMLGTSSTGKMFLESQEELKGRGSLNNLLARIAARATNLILQDAFVPMLASPIAVESQALMMKSGFARWNPAKKSSNAGSISKRSFAPVHVECVLSDFKKADVYNLSVENGEYFANGILVHNCRYNVMAILEGKAEPFKEPKKTGPMEWLKKFAFTPNEEESE